MHVSVCVWLLRVSLQSSFYGHLSGLHKEPLLGRLQLAAGRPGFATFE